MGSRNKTREAAKGISWGKQDVFQPDVFAIAEQALGSLCDKGRALAGLGCEIIHVPKGVEDLYESAFRCDTPSLSARCGSRPMFRIVDGKPESPGTAPDAYTVSASCRNTSLLGQLPEITIGNPMPGAFTTVTIRTDR
jgi:hypothetical protein